MSDFAEIFTEISSGMLGRIPLEIKNNILEFAGYHRLRNGKYMKQIPRDGKFYKKINRRINRIPGKTNSYVVLKVSETVSEIIMGPSFYYSNMGKRL
jgi:hypothetical protein